jgi:hypothetical protein
LWISLALLSAALLVLLCLYLASQYEPPFYREALDADPAEQEKASDQMLQQATALASALKKTGRWESVITADQINGWLAVDMVKNHPNALPPTLCDPRVIIDPDAITVACRFEQSGQSSVISLTVEPYMSELNVLALRIVKARAGLLPMPLGKLFDHITQAAHDMQLHLEWRQSGGHPVALLTLPAAEDDGRQVRIETLRLSDGEIYLAGRTEQKQKGEKEDGP